MQEVVCGAGGACARELQKLILALSYFQLARFDSFQQTTETSMLARPEGLSKGEGKAGQQFGPLLPASVCMNPISLPLHTAPKRR